MSLSFVGLLIVVTLAFWGMANACSLLVHQINQRVCSGQNHKLIWLAAALPLLLPVLVLLALLVISYGKMSGWLDDHCLSHGLHHPHFCLLHFPELSISGWLSAVFISFLCLLSGTIILNVTRLMHHHFQTRGIIQLADNKPLIIRFNHEHPIAFTMGLIKPKVYLSNAIQRVLSKREQRIVVAHESAHLRNKDTLKLTLMQVLLTFHLFPTPIRKSFHLQMELNADKKVASRFNTLEIANVLIKLTRLNIRPVHSISVAGSQLEQRITALLNQSSISTVHSILSVVLILITLLIPVSVMFNHHAIETIIGWLL